MSQHEKTLREITREPGRVSVRSIIAAADTLPDIVIACGEREQVSGQMKRVHTFFDCFNLHKEHGEDPAKHLVTVPIWLSFSSISSFASKPTPARPKWW
jgi:hypothetical protein